MLESSHVDAPSKSSPGPKPAAAPGFSAEAMFFNHGLPGLFVVLCVLLIFDPHCALTAIINTRSTLTRR